MPTHVALAKLIPHPKNSQLPPVDAATYAAMKEDIATHGILHPITVNVRTWHIVMGHHRVQIAQELGWERVPVDLIDVDETEEERLMIADNILRRQIDKPMDKARLIRWLKELHGIKQGKNDSSEKISEEAERIGVTDRTLRNWDKLNDLIPALQAMVDDGSLPQTVASDLARKLTSVEQQALFDAIGAAGIAQVKTSDIQAAKHTPDTRALETQIAALETERDALHAQLEAAQATQTAPASAPDTSSSLLASLQRQLDEAEATRQAYADELARLKRQTPVERIAEKVVDKIVEKPVPDPAQAERIAALESTLTTTQAELTLLKTRRKDLQNYQQERDKLDREINDIKNELARLRDSTNVARYRLTQAAGISQILRKILKDGLSEIPQLEALLADSHGTIFQTDRDLALDVAQQLQRASDLILTAVQQFEDPMVFDVRRGPDPDHPITQALKEAKVLNDHDSIVSPTD